MDPKHAEPHSTRTGLVYGFLAYGAWGVVALYFKLIASVDPLIVLCHRIIWSVVLLTALIALQSRWRELRQCFRDRRLLAMLAVSTVLIANNWYV
ncbi:MAG: EamA family transporter RarD, partial [Tepidisphaeraceae bacterium]